MMMRMLAATAALPIALAAPAAAQMEAASRMEAVELANFPAPEARQGVAADGRFLYVIDNHTIGKYETSSGRRVGGWEGGEDGPIQHLNGGIVVEGRLYAANSNYPEVPMVSSIEIFDVESMTHVGSHSFGIHSGSATWIAAREGEWWVAFANYENRAGVPGRGVAWTTLERFDTEWRWMGGWVFPSPLLDSFRPYSNSGGVVLPGGDLLVTGHDAAELYRLRLPTAGSTLEWVETIAAPIAGQGIALDPNDSSRLYTVDREAKRVRSLRLP